MQKLTLAHSPDADDAFMFYGLATGRVVSGDLRFDHQLSDIETLNRRAMESTYDVTAISFHAYAHLYRRYALLRAGSSFGEGYGPLLVAREGMSAEELAGKQVAVPGMLTSAYLLLKLFAPQTQTVPVPFDQIPDAILNRKADAGVLIHEGQLTYGDIGLRAVVDLGRWWQQETGLPVPLGGLAVRRELDAELVQRIAEAVKASIRYALEHRTDALEYALQFGRGLTTALGDQFVGMYVNDLTLDCGENGRRAVQLLLDRAHQAGLVPERVTVDLQPA
jgi:1,4-dihydroxy-6-naphthoate synthase